jgi:hypothetical protein
MGGIVRQAELRRPALLQPRITLHRKAARQPMNRRPFLLAASAFAVGGCAARIASAQPRYRISAQQLQQALDRRFPARQPVGPLFDLTIEAPQLRCVPELNRLALHTILTAAGPALRRREQGSFDIDFALRYEPADQSIRAYRLRVLSLELTGLPPRTAELLDAYGKALADQAMLQVVLHRLGPRELELADTMGLQPGEITVVPDGIVIGFVARQAR